MKKGRRELLTGAAAAAALIALGMPALSEEFASLSVGRLYVETYLSGDLPAEDLPEFSENVIRTFKRMAGTEGFSPIEEPVTEWNRLSESNLWRGTTSARGYRSPP